MVLEAAIKSRENTYSASNPRWCKAVVFKHIYIYSKAIICIIETKLS